MDLSEQSEACSLSLFVRSKPMRAPTWLRKWNRDSWTQFLSGRILKPSHHKRFEEKWTSCLADIPVSRLVMQESDKEKTTRGIFGRLLPPQLGLFNPVSASSKTSKDTLRLDSTRFYQTYMNLVTVWRQEYSVRMKLARLIREKAFIELLNSLLKP